MTDKELRRLKRPELLEILFYLQKEIESLKQENEVLKQRIESFIQHSNNSGDSENTDNPKNSVFVSDDFLKQITDTIKISVKECLSHSKEISETVPLCTEDVIVTENNSETEL